VGGEKIYVAIVKAFREKERQDETQFITKIDSFMSFTPGRILIHVLFLQDFLKSRFVCDQKCNKPWMLEMFGTFFMRYKSQLCQITKGMLWLHKHMFPLDK